MLIIPFTLKSISVILTISLGRCNELALHIDAKKDASLSLRLSKG
jgi:hypothetical protein